MTQMRNIRLALAAACMMVAIIGCGTSSVENTVHSIADLSGKKIGVQLKTTGDTYASDIENAEVVRFNRGGDAVAALKKGVVDAVIIDDAPAEIFIEQIDGLHLLDEPFANEEYGIAVSKEKPELLEKINAALENLQADGTLDEIKEAWIMGEATVTAYEGQQGTSYANGVLVMTTNAEFPPYESIADDGSIIGMDVDIMKAVCDVLDMELKVQNTDFASVITSLERGMADVAASGITITEERLQQVDFSKAYTQAKQVVIVRD